MTAPMQAPGLQLLGFPLIQQPAGCPNCPGCALPPNGDAMSSEPTLVIVGERDAECPASQSYEFWHALKTLGVPTKLIIYPGEGHMFIEPKHQADRLEETVGWFDKYLK